MPREAARPLHCRNPKAARAVHPMRWERFSIACAEPRKVAHSAGLCGRKPVSACPAKLAAHDQLWSCPMLKENDLVGASPLPPRVRAYRQAERIAHQLRCSAVMPREHAYANELRESTAAADRDLPRCSRYQTLGFDLRRARTLLEGCKTVCRHDIGMLGAQKAEGFFRAEATLFFLKNGNCLPSKGHNGTHALESRQERQSVACC